MIDIGESVRSRLVDWGKGNQTARPFAREMDRGEENDSSRGETRRQLLECWIRPDECFLAVDAVFSD